MGLTRADLPLHHLLRDKAFDQPDRVAIVFGDRSLTFADLPLNRPTRARTGRSD